MLPVGWAVRLLRIYRCPVVATKSSFVLYSQTGQKLLCSVHFFLASALTGLSRASQIKLGPPLFVPNSQVGTFGAVSQIRSLIRSRADLFDVSFAGPAAAAAVSAALFVAGLVLSSGGVPKVSVACLEMHPFLVDSHQ